MTTIRLGVLHPTGTDADARSTGSVEWVPSARRVVGGDVVLPDAFRAALVADADVTVTVAPTTSAWVGAVWSVTAATGGTVPGGAGNDGQASALGQVGGGGSGGGGSAVGVAGSGGNGGAFGAGGGGGGAALNGNNSGNGGTGSTGVCVVTSYF